MLFMTLPEPQDRMLISMHIAVTWFTTALHLSRCLKQVYKCFSFFFFLSQNSDNMDKLYDLNICSFHRDFLAPRMQQMAFEDHVQSDL